VTTSILSTRLRDDLTTGMMSALRDDLGVGLVNNLWKDLAHVLYFQAFLGLKDCLDMDSPGDPR
jgi:hypothetical protein